MHIEPNNIFVACSIALLLGGWSFLFCYLLFSKIRPFFYLLCLLVVLFDLYMGTWYLTGFVLLIANTLASSVMATIGSTMHYLLDKKYNVSKSGYFSLFAFYYVASQLPVILILAFYMFGDRSTIDLYSGPFKDNNFLVLLFYVGPSLGIIPLYMFKTYRPRLGIDTHFPDAGNN